MSVDWERLDAEVLRKAATVPDRPPPDFRLSDAPPIFFCQAVVGGSSVCGAHAENLSHGKWYCDAHYADRMRLMGHVDGEAVYMGAREFAAAWRDSAFLEVEPQWAHCPPPRGRCICAHVYPDGLLCEREGDVRGGDGWFYCERHSRGPGR